MDGDFSGSRLFQFLADHGCDSPALVVFMNIQPVEIAGRVDVAKSHDLFVEGSDKTVMALQRPIPFFRINRSGRPGVQLLRGIISGIDGVNGVIKKL